MNVAQLKIEDLRPWLEVRFSRAGGPGGQHVNKVSTRVALLFDFTDCELLTSFQKHRIRQRLATRLSRDGHLRVICQQTRNQVVNRAVAEQRLIELLRENLKVLKKRVPTRPSRASKERRITDKKRRGQTKRLRQSKVGRDD